MSDAASGLGLVIRTARKQRGLSQEAVAYRVGTEQTEISKIERGKVRPRPELLQRLAEVLELPDGIVSVYLQ